jgi:hypothetical protein
LVEVAIFVERLVREEAFLRRELMMMVEKK